MPWQPSKSTSGPYVTGSVDGRLRELEAQVSELTNLIDSLLRVVQVQSGGAVRIVGARSLTLVAPPAHIALIAGKINVSSGGAEKNLFG